MVTMTIHRRSTLLVAVSNNNCFLWRYILGLCRLLGYNFPLHHCFMLLHFVVQVWMQCLSTYSLWDFHLSICQVLGSHQSLGFYSLAQIDPRTLISTSPEYLKKDGEGPSNPAALWLLSEPSWLPRFGMHLLNCPAKGCRILPRFDQWGNGFLDRFA